MSAIVGSMNLDVDEIGFVREPYEMVGGDYTRKYLAAHEPGHAASVLARSYYFYWKYRPLFAPVIEPKDLELFRREEIRFGYTKPISLRAWDPDRVTRYEHRLVVPEPDRFYRLGAGKPLLSAVVSIPQLALVELISRDRTGLLALQHTHDYHPMFIVARLAQILAGLLTILVVYRILARELDAERALAGAAVMALFPATIMYFPNVHHDAILVPFALLAADEFRRRRYARAGVFLGLALAAKNTAVFLVPAMLAWVAWEALAPAEAGTRAAWRGPLLGGLRGLAITLLAAALVLLPFANPVSYAEEILTPVVHRPQDPRGPSVGRYTLAGRLDAPEGRADKYAHRSVTRPEVRLTRRLGFGDFGFLFTGLAVLLLFSRRNGPLARMCILVLLLSIPYGVLFERELSYRALLFVPFLALLAAEVSAPRPLRYFVALLVLIDVVYCVDPMTTDTMHYPVEVSAAPP